MIRNDRRERWRRRRSSIKCSHEQRMAHLLAAGVRLCFLAVVVEVEDLVEERVVNMGLRRL
jgi:hypothetical protein